MEGRTNQLDSILLNINIYTQAPWENYLPILDLGHDWQFASK